jgi:hypothetical protein
MDFFFLNGARRVYQRKTDNTRKSTNKKSTKHTHKTKD